MALSPTEEAQVRSLIAQNPALLNLAASESTIISKLGATKTNLSALAAATSLSDADIALVRQGLSDKSFAMSVLRDYVSANLPTASTTTKGIVELATNTETQTGTDAVRAVTPAGLASVTATETRAGLLEIATTAEARALTNDTTALTPKKLADAFVGGNQSLTANGYQKMPGGLIVQWGTNVTVSAGAVTVTFPITFPNGCRSVSATPRNDTTGNESITYFSKTASSCIFTTTVDAGVQTGINFDWFAIGY